MFGILPLLLLTNLGVSGCPDQLIRQSHLIGIEWGEQVNSRAWKLSKNVFRLSNGRGTYKILKASDLDDWSNDRDAREIIGRALEVQDHLPLRLVGISSFEKKGDKVWATLENIWGRTLLDVLHDSEVSTPTRRLLLSQYLRAINGLAHELRQQFPKLVLKFSEPEVLMLPSIGRVELPSQVLMLTVRGRQVFICFCPENILVDAFTRELVLIDPA